MRANSQKAIPLKLHLLRKAKRAALVVRQRHPHAIRRVAIRLCLLRDNVDAVTQPQLHSLTEDLPALFDCNKR
jgi:hypothetical protein